MNGLFDFSFQCHIVSCIYKITFNLGCIILVSISYELSVRA